MAKQAKGQDEVLGEGAFDPQGRLWVWTSGYLEVGWEAAGVQHMGNPGRCSGVPCAVNGCNSRVPMGTIPIRPHGYPRARAWGKPSGAQPARYLFTFLHQIVQGVVYCPALILPK